MPAEKLLRAESLAKGFGEGEARVELFSGLSLELGAGEAAAIVGPSGCGKSTLLRMVAGLEETTAGSIAIGGRDVTRLDPSERGVAMVFQTYALYPHMTVAENMAFALKLKKARPEEILRKVRPAAEILGLEPQKAIVLYRGSGARFTMPSYWQDYPMPARAAVDARPQVAQ